MLNINIFIYTYKYLISLHQTYIKYYSIYSKLTFYDHKLILWSQLN